MLGNKVKLFLDKSTALIMILSAYNILGILLSAVYIRVNKIDKNLWFHETLF